MTQFLILLLQLTTTIWLSELSGSAKSDLNFSSEYLEVIRENQIENWDVIDI